MNKYDRLPIDSFSPKYDILNVVKDEIYEIEVLEDTTFLNRSLGGFFFERLTNFTCYPSEKPNHIKIKFTDSLTQIPNKIRANAFLCIADPMSYIAFDDLTESNIVEANLNKTIWVTFEEATDKFGLERAELLFRNKDRESLQQVTTANI